jgi:D-alanine-D-alanine ligase-like ATP-grasp enzyme
MIIRLLLIFSYIVYCIKLWVFPYRYFQLNAVYFNEQRNIFSKLDIDQLIPERWRLKQSVDVGNIAPDSYPVFIKPEWGQNSYGVNRADNPEELALIRQNRGEIKVNYLIQEAASGRREFEVFIIPSDSSTEYADIEQPAILSITETVNSSSERFPINGIYNKTSSYQDLTDQFDSEQRALLWQHLKQIGQFRIARFGLRADSIDTLSKGNFQVIEINLFLPMPLTLISQDMSRKDKLRFVLKSMRQLAKLTKSIPRSQVSKSVFFKKFKLSRTLKLNSGVRPQS